MVESMISNDPRMALDEKEGLMDALSSDDPGARIIAVKGMEKLGGARSVTLLAEALKNEHYDVREAAYQALRRLGYRAMPALVRASKDENFYVRMYATLAITDLVMANPGRKYGDDIIDALTHALLDKSIYVRRSAYDALKVIEYAKILKSLMGSLSDPDNNVRLEAIIALGKIADKRSAKALVKTLSDKDTTIRKYAASALGRIKDKRVTGPLAELLRDPEGSVRKEAVKALGAIGDERAVPALLRALKDTEPSVRGEAIDALNCYRSFRHATPFLETLGDEAAVRVVTARALGKVRGTKAVATLIGMLGDRDPEVREASQVALARIGHGAIKPLRSALSDDSDLIRCGAARALELMSKAKARKRIERSNRIRSSKIWGEIEAAISACSKERQADLFSFEL